MVSIFGHEEQDHRVLVHGALVDSFPLVPPRTHRGTPRRITIVGEKVLRDRCAEVTEFGTPALSRLIDDMFATMYISDGVGLAANQIDVNLRVFVYDCPNEAGDRHVGHLINPIVDPQPRMEAIADMEGCLSVPGATKTVTRAKQATVHGFIEDGSPVTITGTDYFARCLLHETDHLNGKLYIDHLSKVDRNAALREMEDEKDKVFARRAAKITKFTNGR